MAKKSKQTFNSKKDNQMSTTDQTNVTDENLDTTGSLMEGSSEDTGDTDNTGEQVETTTDSQEKTTDTSSNEVTEQQEASGKEETSTIVIEPTIIDKAPVTITTTVEDPTTTTVETDVKEEPTTNSITDEVPFISQASTSDVILTSIKHQLDSYAEVMAPGKPVSHTEGALRQKSLWNSIKAVIETEDVDFEAGWNMLVEEFKSKHLSPRYVNRFNEHLTLSLPELHAFERMVNLLILTADENTKNEVLKHVDLDRTLAEGISEFGRNRIINYYHK